MNAPRIPRILVAGALAAALGACASVPEPLAGDFPEFLPDQATERSVGAEVRWGGMVVETRPGQRETCVEILARELDRNQRPVVSDVTHGRYLACRDDFLDPEIFTNGREVTTVGRITGFEEGRVGEFSYRYPRIQADVIYLWPEPVPVVYYPYYHPYYGFYPYYYGPYRYPYYRYPRTRVSGSIHIRR